MNLLLTRTFFSLQRPWLPTALAVGNMVVNAAVSVALYKPFGIAGLVIGTVVGNVAMTLGQTWRLRAAAAGQPGGPPHADRRRCRCSPPPRCSGSSPSASGGGSTTCSAARCSAQIVSVGAALATGVAVYVAAVLAIGIPEARQIRALVAGRFKRGGA